MIYFVPELWWFFLIWLKYSHKRSYKKWKDISTSLQFLSPWLSHIIYVYLNFIAEYSNILYSYIGDKIDHSFNDASMQSTTHAQRQQLSLISNLISNQRSNLRSNQRSNLKLNQCSNLRLNLSSSLRILSLKLNLRSNQGTNLRSDLSLNLMWILRSNLRSNWRSNLTSNERFNFGSNWGWYLRTAILNEFLKRHENA